MATAKEHWRHIAQIRPDETIGLVNIHSRSEIPLKSVTCHVTIRGFIADVEAILHYESEARDESEAVFVFPLEPGSVVYSFTMRANERLMVGECQSKYAAMRRYFDSVAEGRSLAMLVLEDTDTNVFRCGVGALPSHTPVIIRLRYTQELDVRADRGIHYTLPGLMNPAQRPQRAGFQRQWSLMSQTSLTRGTLNRASLRPGTLFHAKHVPLALDFELEVIGQHKVMAIKTPHDQLTGSFLNQEETHVKGTLSEPFKFDHDLTLGVYYENVDAPAVIVEPVSMTEADGLLDGTVVMINFAPTISDEGPVLGEIKEFVLMIDCSSDKHFERIREAIGYFLKSLPLGAFFNICTYSDNFKFLFPQGSQPYCEASLRQGVALQRTIEPNVGSFPNLHGPVGHLFRRYNPPAGCQRQVIVISSGVERFTAAICKLASDNTHNTRVHTIGINPDRSPCVVSELATAGQGTSQYVHDSAACLPAKLMRCMRCAVLPCVRDLDLDWTLPEGVTVTVVPSELPTLLFGERCIIYAVLKGQIPPEFVNRLRISGVNHGMYFTHDVAFRVPEAEVDLNVTGSDEPALPIHRLMAKSWMDETFNRCYTDLPGTIAGREANVVSRFTTFVLVDKSGGHQPVPLLEHSCLDNSLLPPNLRTKPRRKCGKAPLKNWLAKASGAIFRRRSKQKALPASELTQMVAIQKWNGSWELDKPLSELLCVPLKIIRKENPYKVVQEDVPWATALAVVWMEGYHEEKVCEWDLLADKATTFLRNQRTDCDELLRRAAFLLGLQIEEVGDTYW